MSDLTQATRIASAAALIAVAESIRLTVDERAEFVTDRPDELLALWHLSDNLLAKAEELISTRSTEPP